MQFFYATGNRVAKKVLPPGRTWQKYPAGNGFRQIKEGKENIK
jgi:hypothetical protein